MCENCSEILKEVLHHLESTDGLYCVDKEGITDSFQLNNEDLIEKIKNSHNCDKPKLCREDDCSEEWSRLFKYTSFKDLLEKYAGIEENYKSAKTFYNHAKNQTLVLTDWDEVNKARAEQGLPKLGSMDMKKAWAELDNECLKDIVDNWELKYNMIKRDYEVALKYSLESIK